MYNDRVSSMECRGFVWGWGTGWTILLQPKPVHQVQVGGFDPDLNSARKRDQCVSMLPAGTSTTLGNGHSCSFSSVLTSLPSLPIKWTFPPHQKLIETRQEQEEGVCFTSSPNKVHISSILTRPDHLITLFSTYRHCLDT